MIPDIELAEGNILIVTGSTLRAEKEDRPLAYRLKETIEGEFSPGEKNHKALILGDLWYLNSELLHHMPTISVGAPKVNSLSAYLLKRLTRVLVVENSLVIQMDPHLEDLRVSVWGMSAELTHEAMELFVRRRYLERFLGAAARRKSKI
jgi:hypothetical protein